MLDDKNTPYGNTGCMDTRQKSLIACVDWVSVTFFDVKFWEDIVRLLGLKVCEFTETNRGYLGYKNTVICGNILIAYNGNSNMGVHLKMSGQACREYEQFFKKNTNVWSDLFLLITTENHKFSRLDVAIDDFKTYFTIEQLYSCAKRGCMTAKRIKKARSYEEFFIDTGETDSRTLYVGKSDWMIRFYNKYVERLNKGYSFDENITAWNRYELQLRRNVATMAAKLIAHEVYELGEFVRGFMAEKIDFKVKNSKDTNKSRWKRTRWWQSFLDDVEKISLTQIAPDPTIPKIHNWLDKQVNTSFMTYIEAFDYNPIVLDYFRLRGHEKIDVNKEKIIKEFNDDPELKQKMLNDMAIYLQTKKDNQFDV